MNPNGPAHAPSFLDEVLAGRAMPEQIDEWVARWHVSPDTGATSLDAYLGFTPAEGRAWASHPEMLEYIIKDRRNAAATAPDVQPAPKPRRRRKKPRPPRQATAPADQHTPPVAPAEIVPSLRPGYPATDTHRTPWPACRHCTAPIRRTSAGWLHIPISTAPWRQGHFLLCRSSISDPTGSSIPDNTVASPHPRTVPARYRAVGPVGTKTHDRPMLPGSVHRSRKP